MATNDQKSFLSLGLKIIIWAGLALAVLAPLLVSSQFYFPFIYTKSLVFKLAVELTFVAYLLLAVFDEKYRLKLNRSTLLFSLFILSSLVSAALGVNFYRSFWSNMERQEGLFLLLHLLMFFVVLTNFIKTKKAWFYVLDFSIAVSLLIAGYALLQYFKIELPFFNIKGDSRLASTLGNASYLAGYLIFNMLFAVYLLLFRQKNTLAKIYYPAAIILEFFILLQTGTRGGFIALGVVIVSILLFLVFRASAKIKKIAIGSLIFFGLLTALLFIFKDGNFVSKFSALQRITSINLTDQTAQTRLMTWQESWQGFKERPILGYGYENFNVVFNKYFNPKFYEDEGSTVWFDRAHNVVFDRLITGGAIGLILYLLFLLYPAYQLSRFKSSADDEVESSDFVQSFAKLILVLIVVAYFIQNLFVFDHLTSLMPLFLSLAFMAFLSQDKSFSALGRSKLMAGFCFVIVLILIIPLFYFGLVKPTQANLTIIDGLALDNGQFNEEVIDDYKRAIAYDTYGNQEFRLMLASYVSQRFSTETNVEYWQKVIDETIAEMDKQIQEQPQNVMNYLAYMRFNNEIRTLKSSFLSKNFDLFEEAIKLSKNRTHLYYEIGYTQLFLGKHYLDLDKADLSRGFYADAIKSFKKALDLSPDVIEANTTYFMALVNAGQFDAAMEQLEQMAERGVNYKQVSYLANMIDTAVYFKQYQIAKRLYTDLIEIQPNVPQFLIGSALVHAYLGENDSAIELAERIEQLDPNYAQSADTFIQEVKSGKYRATNQ